MSNRFRYSAPAFLHLATVMLAASPCLAAWQNSFAFGSTLQGDLYTPTTVAASPAILVAIHYCSGHSSNAHGWFDSYANTNGFYIIAPDAGKNCFDSSATRGGDRAAIVTMVNYLITNKNADKNRVFSAGFSSGGCMTNTLLAIYPDVFAGGSALPGFPAGTWPAGDTSCTKCGSTPPNNTAQQWGDLARNAFSWSGTRPCVQEWVGGADEYNFNLYLPAVAAQFQNLSNLSSGTAGTGAPSGWTRTVYKDGSGNVRLETNLGPSTQKHDLTGAGLFSYVISYLGLDKPTGSCGITSAGGATSTGGAPSTGGTKATTGGTSAIGTGGTRATTGGTSSLSTGGTIATGGNTSTTVSPTGGTTSIVSNTGGSNATGGAANSTGGTKSTGGAANAGGPANTGGNNATGGAVGNGGTIANGGAVSTGGLIGNGGTKLTTSGDSSAGGASDIGGSSGTGTGAGNSSDNAGSCSCRVAGQRQSWLASLGGLLGLALLRNLRRKRSR